MRILVLRALGLGDLLTAVPALRALRRAHPAARIVLAAPAALAAVAELVGGIDEVVDTAPLAPLAASVAGADLAVNLHGSGPQSTALLRAARPGRLVAYGVTAQWRDDEHEVRRWCRLLVEAGIPADPADLDLLVDAPASGSVLVHPGSAQAARRWPAQRWAAVVRGLGAGAFPGRPGDPVLVTAGPGEERLAHEVAAAAGLPTTAVVSGLSLHQLAALVAGARLLLCADTGVGHLATAVRTPSVVLFGPVPPSHWGPPADRPWHVALWGGQRSDPRAEVPAPALLALQPAEVVQAALDLLAGARPPTGHGSAAVGGTVDDRA